MSHDDLAQPYSEDGHSEAFLSPLVALQELETVAVTQEANQHQACPVMGVSARWKAKREMMMR
jgi:hypothetical protein